MHKLAKGHTLFICYGAYAGFRFDWTKHNKRIVLGCVSIAWAHCDIEVVIDKLLNKVKEAKEELYWDSLAQAGIKQVQISDENYKALSESWAVNGNVQDICKMHTQYGEIEITKWSDN